MSLRALFIGFLGAALICSVTYFNDWVLRQTFLVGNHMPVAAYGGLLLLLLVNGFVFRFRREWSLRRGELATILALTLAGCCIPSSGLMRTFTTSLMLPHYHTKTESGWQKHRLVDELAPPMMLADISSVVAEGTVASATESSVGIDQTLDSSALGDLKIVVIDSDGYRQVRRLMAVGEAEGSYTLDDPWAVTPEPGTAFKVLGNNEAESLTPFTVGNPDSPEIRWSAWKRTLLFWCPLIVFLWMIVIGLSLVVHKQWSHHEQLPYPVAKFANALFPDESGNNASIFRKRGFWIAAGVVCLIYVNNYVQTYFPDTWISIRTRINISPLTRMLDLRGMARWAYGNPRIYFTVIAIAYFLPSDVSLSVGISPLVYGFVSAWLLSMGTDITEGGSRAINYEGFFLFGSYLGIAMMIAYNGRRFYTGTVKRAVGMSSGEDIPTYAVWGARFCAIGVLCFVLQAARTGLEWYAALFYLFGLVMMLTVMSRILAETGLFFIQTRFVISSIVVGIMGPQSLGLESCLVLFMFSAVLAIDPRETLMPFIVNSSQMLDSSKAKVGRVTAMAGLAAGLGLAIAVPVTLHLQHAHGGNLADSFGASFVPRFAFQNTLRLKQRLEKRFDTVGKPMIKGEGVRKIKPMKWRLFIALGIGMACAVGFSILRLRVNWWPLHPVLFLVCAGYGTACFGPSFLMGWFFKLMITKYGGSKIHQQLTPIMIGLIVGEIFGALIPILASYVRYWITGEPPTAFSVFPT